MLMSGTKQFGCKYSPNDEHYTSRKTADYIIGKYFSWLQGKRICLPCDSENSELYKVCKERGLDCECSQDMFNTDYTNFDLIFTNPPFSMATKFARYLDSIGKKFLLFAPWSSINAIARYSLSAYYIEDFEGPRYTDFIRPDGTFRRVHWGLITNLDEGREVVENKPDIRIQPTDEWQNYRGIWRDATRCNYLKWDWRNRDRLYVRKKQQKI